jgi:hypothetical protein
MQKKMVSTLNVKSCSSTKHFKTPFVKSNRLLDILAVIGWPCWVPHLYMHLHLTQRTHMRMTLPTDLLLCLCLYYSRRLELLNNTPKYCGILSYSSGLRGPIMSSQETNCHSTEAGKLSRTVAISFRKVFVVKLCLSEQGLCYVECAVLACSRMSGHGAGMWSSKDALKMPRRSLKIQDLNPKFSN